MTAIMLAEATGIAIIRALPHMLPADFDSLGITQEEYDLVSSPHAWRREHANRIMKVMRALLHGAVEAMSFPPIDLPGEFVSAVIATVVHPGNQASACSILADYRQSGSPAADLASGTQPQIDVCTSRQLFALVCIFLDRDETNQCRLALAKKFGSRITKALQTGKA